MATTASSGTAVVTLPGETQIHVARDFNAPKDLVYRALRSLPSSAAGGTPSAAR